MSNRDNFTQAAITILAKRVGYLCSNPSCRKPTSGPNSNDNKATTIGEAAHITAAAPGGPRYDGTLTSNERSHINNGIWLCSNCASLIDKDAASYSTELLKFWKAQTEFELSNALSGTNRNNKPKNTPVIEAELLRGTAWSGPHNYSIFHKIEWKLRLIIRNNSSFPAYHLKLVFDSNSELTISNNSLTRSNLTPFGEWELEANTELIFEGDGLVADSYLRYRIPRHLNNLSFKISYKDEERNDYSMLVTVKDDEIINELNK
jgi:hypothetical protein